MKDELTKKQEGSSNGNTALAVGQNEIDRMFGNAKLQIPVDAPLPMVKILRETPMFELPDGQTIKELVGHIIYWHNANQYYSKAFGEGETVIPDCFSSDGINPDGGTDPQVRPCKDCEYNKYGSATDGNGKACSNTIRLYLLIDGDVIPVLLKASPSSLGKKESLMKWLTNAPNIAAKAGCGTAYQPIKVKFTLHKKDFTSGFSASVLDLATVKVLNPANETEMAEIKKLAILTTQFKEAYLGLGKVSQYMAQEAPDAAETVPAEQQDEVPI